MAKTLLANLPLNETRPEGVFRVFEAHAQVRDISVETKKTRDAQPVPPLVLGAPTNTAHEPMPETFGKSAAWSLTVHGISPDPQDGNFLRIRARGDVARLFSGTTMLDDRFLDGGVWEIGLSNFAHAQKEPLTLTILPLRRDAPIYLEAGVAKMVSGEQTAEIVSVDVVHQYRLKLSY
jgi:hypothetical protein